MGKDSQAAWKASELIRKNFPFDPTSGQSSFFQKMDAFLSLEPGEKPCFVLRGYAGTGKTSVISALVQSLPKLKMRSLLLA
ncbi:MAG TPA: ATP-dependent endonuclease, partial [Algoriphagus sp.]|nr:ATP-dependent endonuclease [Algoriphagus sp.]